jgi:preprotein translocase subunit SecD
MIALYRVPGVMAVVALGVYTFLTLAVFKLVPVTLTLAGIAGFILSIGMAVDANILVFERMREELRAGKTVRAAMEAGFERAWSSIRDSNVSTLITCGILYWFGTSQGASIIAGFALTLAIGVAVSMFSAVFVTRSLLRALVNAGAATRPEMFGVPRTPSATPAAAGGPAVAAPGMGR